MADPLWTSSEIAAATKGAANAAFSVSGITIDSRILVPGDLFVAIKDQRDGHDFVAAAMAAGAGGALVSRPTGTQNQVVVDDTLAGLTALGLAARDRSSATRVAVTGSVGKTSVKEMLAQIFRAAGPAHWSEKSFNNQWGVPLTLARMPQQTERAVFEIGMSTPGEIAPRSRMVAPHGALITAIAPAHLEGLGSVQAIANEKADIFSGLLPGGAICLPADSDWFEHLAARALAHQPHAEIFTFGEDPEAAVHVMDYHCDGQTTRTALSVFGQPFDLDMNTVGRHWAVNASAAILLACATGAMRPRDAVRGLMHYTAPGGRGDALRLSLPNGGTYLLIDDAYNANPASMEAGIAAFGERRAKRRIIALGEMRELGPNAESMHADLAASILGVRPEKLFLAGPLMGALKEAIGGACDVEWAQDALDLQPSITKALAPDVALLIKGSNASGMGKLVAALKSASMEAGVTSQGQNGAGDQHAL
jgi:UDP-N-acetylmuramoyl-tripeptide--D-alanyl-D-alanine ligase